MNRQETLNALAVLEVAYPAFYNKQTAEVKNMTVNLWMYQFADISASTVNAGLMSLISARDSSFPPSIGEVKAEIVRLFSPDKLTPLEAWDAVKRAMRKCGYGGTRKAWERLPESVRDVISPSELESMAFDENFNNSVEFSNFQKSYLAKKQEKNVYALLPSKVKALIQNNSNLLKTDKNEPTVNDAKNKIR